MKTSKGENTVTVDKMKAKFSFCGKNRRTVVLVTFETVNGEFSCTRGWRGREGQERAVVIIVDIDYFTIFRGIAFIYGTFIIRMGSLGCSTTSSSGHFGGTCLCNVILILKADDTTAATLSVIIWFQIWVKWKMWLNHGGSGGGSGRGRK